jgi:RNAse (barnase) inhibitor barstar
MDLLAYSNDSEVSGSNAPWRRDGLRHGALLTGQLEEKMSLLMRVAPNIVQAIRAFNVGDLQQEAGQLGHHFLYAHCANTLTKQQVCARIGEQFYFPKPCSKNFDALRKCLTETVHDAGPQPGFIVVLEQLPSAQKFDKEARENLLDVFRDAAEFWAEKKVPFRVFYSFATVPPAA